VPIPISSAALFSEGLGGTFFIAIIWVSRQVGLLAAIRQLLPLIVARGIPAFPD
jgi:hypothetical protein